MPAYASTAALGTPEDRAELARRYLESFFRAIDKPQSIKKTFVDGCKPQETM